MRLRQGPGHTVSTGTAVPTARIDQLVVSEFPDEVLIYDEARHHIHHLNRTAATVWRLCDGQRAIPELVRLTRQELGAAVDDAVVRLALAELDQANLLEPALAADSQVAAQTRRTVLRRLGAAGAAMLVPTVMSITAPEAADAFSPPGETCNKGTCDPALPSPCCSGYVCCPNRVLGWFCSEGVC